MGDTKIGWTDKTWNPATGCSKVSTGCKNCYAEAQTERFPKSFPNGFKYTEHADRLGDPRRWKKPAKVFVNSMSDFFHEDATYYFQASALEVMRSCPQHQFQILTKRPVGAKLVMDRYYRGLYHGHEEGVAGNMRYVVPNIWIGTSVEDRETFGRVQSLIDVPAAVRFISFEPLLGPIGRLPSDLDGALGDMGGTRFNRWIHWAIIGGESGPNHRPIREEWVMELIGEMESLGVPVFFKQWGGLRPTSGGRTVNGRTYDGWPEGHA